MTSFRKSESGLVLLLRDNILLNFLLFRQCVDLTGADGLNIVAKLYVPKLFLRNFRFTTIRIFEKSLESGFTILERFPVVVCNERLSDRNVIY